jgi:DNA replication protein DnaC
MSCPLCDDTGWKPEGDAIDDGPAPDRAKGSSGASMAPVRKVRRVVRCDCWRDKVTKRALELAKIPARYQKCEFANFVTYPNDSLLNAVATATRFANSFPAVDKGLMIIGPPGVGKTHLAISALRQAIRTTGARGCYYDTRGLLTQIRSTYNSTTKTAEMDVIRPVMDAELLILDDLGAERLTDWVEETMNVIVNARYNAKLPTIFTSNYEDIPGSDDMNSLLVRVGFRLHSRLREMCHFLEYDGPDYRDLPPNADADDIYKLWKSQPRRKLPARASGSARAQLRTPATVRDGKGDLKWPGGRGGS